jgi:membrane associated rhomboid family serine protease
MDFATPLFPKGVRALIVVTVAVWFLQLLPGAGAALNGWFDLVPYKTFSQWQVWRLFTYLFLHDPSGSFHVMFNMLTLWMFGAEIESMWGTRKFVLFYLLCGACAGLFSLATVLSPVMWFVPVIGASGAVLALLTVYALYFPRRQMLLFFLFPVNVIVAVIIFGAISLLGSLHSWGNVSHLTHLGGIVAGFLYVKTFPFISYFLDNAKMKAERALQKAHDQKKTEEKEYFGTVIDPILKKISQSGMESLSKNEKQTLEEASKRKKKVAGDSGKILPFRRP